MQTGGGWARVHACPCHDGMPQQHSHAAGGVKQQHLPCCAAQLAKEQGDFLLVGLHTDEDVGARRGPHTPIMNVHERALSVLACKYVDEVRAQAVRRRCWCSSPRRGGWGVCARSSGWSGLQVCRWFHMCCCRR
jgi:hypothetical protein